MKCYSGIETANGLVPCGQCMNCRVNKGRHWTVRILMEELANYEKYGERGWFCTLTIEADRVSVTRQGNLTLAKKPFQNWLRNVCQRVARVRYYAVGEYGDDTFRPHYHLGLFPRHHSEVPKILDEWKLGYTSCSPLTGKRARYLANYTAKKLTKGNDKRLQEDMEPEFRCSSRVPPIGSTYLPFLIHPYCRSPGKELLEERGDVERTIRIGGKVYGLPPFILSKMREALGIPLLHRDRLGHPGYWLAHQNQELAEWDPDKARKSRKKHAAKKKLAKSITQNV